MAVIDNEARIAAVVTAAICAANAIVSATANAIIHLAVDSAKGIISFFLVAFITWATRSVAEAITPGAISAAEVIVSVAMSTAEAIDTTAIGAIVLDAIDAAKAIGPVAIGTVTTKWAITQLELQATKLFSLKKDLTIAKRQLDQLQQQHAVAKQALTRKDQKLQHETTEYERLKRLMKEHISSSNEVTNSYDIGQNPCGVAVIINNIHFEDMAERDGAEGDTDRLRDVFESLAFTVVTFRDLDHSKMVATMKNQGKADHSNYDCFVCVIMSHGTMGKVYSSDDVGIDIFELMKPVNAKKCPSLKGKPKLFFIQACQGEKTQRKEGFDHGEYDAKPVPFICHEADFFLGLATVPGYVARRDQDGAPYVHHLAKLLKDFGPTHDLSAIMAMVCDKMNNIHDDKFGWISSNHSTLRKKVVFSTK